MQFLEAETQGTGPAAAQDPEQRFKVMKRLSDIHLETVGVLDKVQRGGCNGQPASLTQFGGAGMQCFL